VFVFIPAQADLTAGLPDYVLFAGGYDEVTNFDNTDKIALSDGTRTAGTALAEPANAQGTCGNRTRGIFIGTYGSPGVQGSSKYTYSGDVVAAGTDLSVLRSTCPATTIATKGLFAGGVRVSDSTTVATADIYTLATDGVAGSTSLGAARTEHAATGNVEKGVFAGGSNSAGTILSSSEKNTYASDTWAAGGALTQARKWLFATGKNEVGLFCGGHGGGFFGAVTTVDKYTHSNDTAIEGTELFAEVGENGAIRGSGAGTVVKALLHDGDIVTEQSAIVRYYKYSDDTVNTFSDLHAEKYWTGATCARLQSAL
jgi:hypothetical protein